MPCFPSRPADGPSGLTEPSSPSRSLPAHDRHALCKKLSAMLSAFKLALLSFAARPRLALDLRKWPPLSARSLEESGSGKRLEDDKLLVKKQQTTQIFNIWA